MTKSVMIEIDESTKDIMSELEESIIKSIQRSFSSSIEKSINDQASQIQQINEIVQAEMENMRDEISSSIKPISRVSRDVEDTLRSVTKLEKQYNVQMQALQSLQNGQLETIQKELSNLFNGMEQQNTKLFQVGLDNFKNKNSQLIDEFATKLSVIKDEYMTDLNWILTQVKEQLQLLENVTVQISQKEEYFTQLLAQLNEQKMQQQHMFEEQQQNLSTQSNAIMTSLSQEVSSFSHKLTTQLSATMEKLELTQIHSNEVLAQSLATFEKTQSKMLEDSMTKQHEILESKTKLLLKSIDQKDSFLAIQNRMNQMELTVLEAINTQVLFAKLTELEKDLAYQRLPFYKKWFTKREDY
ncbi:hypothetical protein [Psychrobacillus sp. FSL H8-0510]|uniref:hypothetical protein n=1 Tax=Psychrobacillus sp. FSL H8-0510 TaxID=2921394 RepID=UPI0030F5B317